MERGRVCNMVSGGTRPALCGSPFEKQIILQRFIAMKQEVHLREKTKNNLDKRVVDSIFIVGEMLEALKTMHIDNLIIIHHNSSIR